MHNAPADGARRCYGGAVEFPSAFVARLEAELGPDAAAAILASMCRDKRPCYWVNPLRGGDTPAIGEPLPGLDGVFVADVPRADLVREPAAGTGRIYVINPSSVLGVLALDPQPGESVLDLAAAPGGKTLLAAARMRNTGSIIAVDAVKSRYYRLRANLERCGVGNAHCRLADGRRLGGNDTEAFDRVLLDAPCSSEARFRADDPRTCRYWSPRKVREMAHKQRGLIRAAFRCVKPGGTLVYCTCSFGRKENEAVVEYLLRREPSACVVPIEWPSVAAAGPGMIEGTVRVAPDAVFDGFFVARLVRLAAA